MPLQVQSSRDCQEHFHKTLGPIKSQPNGGFPLCLLRLQVPQGRQVQRPMVYQKLQARRNSSALGWEESVNWEIWSDANNDRVRHRVEDAFGRRFVSLLKETDPARAPQPQLPALPPILAELEQIFQANHMDRQAPLSPTAYEAWRKSIRGKTEQVIETKRPGGDTVLTLTTTAAGPFAANAIVKADLVVRAEDWHPIQQHMHVQREKEIVDYELSEMAFDVLALNALPPSIFADLTPPPHPIATPRMPTAPKALLPTAAELMTAEVEAWYTLHDVSVSGKADLNESSWLELDRSPGNGRDGGTQGSNFSRIGGDSACHSKDLDSNGRQSHCLFIASGSF